LAIDGFPPYNGATVNNWTDSLAAQYNRL